MIELNIGLAAVGALMLIIGLLSEPLKRSFVSGPMVRMGHLHCIPSYFQVIYILCLLQNRL